KLQCGDTGDVVGDRHGCGGHRYVQGGAGGRPRARLLVSRQGGGAGAAVGRLGGDLLDTGAGTDRVVVDLGAAQLLVLVNPLCVKSVWEARTSARQLSRGACT